MIWIGPEQKLTGNKNIMFYWKMSISLHFSKAARETYFFESEVVGYLTKAENLNLLLVRNAGHMVPMSQPPYAQQMIEDFTSGKM